jgi:TrmH family RNA methyltransferase
MERITSRQNAIVKRFRDLARATATGRDAEILLDGEHLVQEALASDVPVEVAAFSGGQLADSRSAAARMAKDVQKRGGRVLAVGDSVLAAMSPVQQPSGVVAIARARHVEIADVMSAPSDLPVVLILAGLQDPGNVGAIIRTAAAFGASGVAAIDGSANPFGWKALRGAMGGTFRIPIAAGGTMPDAIAAARARNMRVIAAVARDGTPLPNVRLRTPTAILLGAEGGGLPAPVLAAVDETVTIPMHAPVESLNVAVAAAIILYEASRQRRR